MVSNFTRLTAREITCNNFEKSLVVFMPNVTTNHAITYTNPTPQGNKKKASGFISSLLFKEAPGLLTTNSSKIMFEEKITFATERLPRGSH